VAFPEQRGHAYVARRLRLLAQRRGLLRHPWDIGLGHLVKFDHDFIGRAALEQMAGKPHRRKVTLVW